MTRPIIRVVSGLLVDQRANGSVVLMGLRKPSRLRPGLWELPGGKVEDGESYEDAVRREWLEECGLAVSLGPFLTKSTLDLDDVLEVSLYRIYRHQVDEPRLVDHAELRWVRPVHAMERLPCSPAFYLHYRAICDHLRGSL